MREIHRISLKGVIAILLFSLLFILSAEELKANSNDFFHAQPDTITFQVILGSSLKVPENKVWKVIKVECLDGGIGILVTSLKFKEKYSANESIKLPFMVNEMHLLTDSDNAELKITIEEHETY